MIGRGITLSCGPQLSHPVRIPKLTRLSGILTNAHRGGILPRHPARQKVREG